MKEKHITALAWVIAIALVVLLTIVAHHITQGHPHLTTYLVVMALLNFLMRAVKFFTKAKKKKLRKLNKQHANTDEKAPAPIGFTRPSDGEETITEKSI